jgi:hypothetical protein
LINGTAESKVNTLVAQLLIYVFRAHIHFDQLLAEGVFEDFAEVARLENVSRARVTQILNLRLLAPDIQETVLRLPRTVRGHDQINFRTILSILLEPDWKKQRSKLEEIQKKCDSRLDERVSNLEKPLKILWTKLMSRHFSFTQTE